MNHDGEKTHTSEIPQAAVAGNIVHVDFARASRARSARNGQHFIHTGDYHQPIVRFPGMPWIREIDLQAPWVLRMLAVVLVLALSMLIL